MDRYRCLSTAAAVVVLLWAAAAYALINPRFTPVHLVKQSALILEVDLKQGQSKDEYAAAIRGVLKGKTELKSLRLDLSKARDVQNADAFRALAAAGRPALFFAGKFDDAGGTGGAPAQSRGLLHISGGWAACEGGQDGAWLFDNVDQQFQAVWAGGTDMLRRAVDYVLTDDDPVVPVTDGVSWSPNPVKVAALDDAIRAVRPIDLAGDGKLLLLFIACDKGDRLLACDAKSKKFTDVTAARGLQSRSQAFAWGDFAGQGRLDLVSFDGKAVSLHAQQADGKFQARPLDLGNALENGCLGLAALDCGVRGRSGLLVSGNSWPVLVALDAEGKPSPTVLSATRIDLAKLGKAGQCLVADFDGDSFADILAPREAGSMLFRGVAPGKFAPGVACAVKLGKGPSGACLGDFDADGRLDVLCVNAEGMSLWENEGDGKFTDRLDLSGELAYISQPGGIECMACDVNNDGRQDALIAYGAKGPQLFFSRGFRSFGRAHTIDLAEQKLLPAAEEGQQSARLGDFDGDGAQDMALALRNGEV